jgi:hypothetical protein
MSLTRRFSKGLQLLASYTYAKSLDNASGQDGLDTSHILGNQLDDRANRGVSDFDRTHRFVLSYLWDLPRRRSRRGQGWDYCCCQIGRWQGSQQRCAGRPIDIVDSVAGSFILDRIVDSPGQAGRLAQLVKQAMTNVPVGYYFNPLAFARPMVQPGR